MLVTSHNCNIPKLASYPCSLAILPVNGGEKLIVFIGLSKVNKKTAEESFEEAN